VALRRSAPPADWRGCPGGADARREEFNRGVRFLHYIHPQIYAAECPPRPAVGVAGSRPPPSTFGGLALSPEGKSFLFGQNELNEFYIMIVKDFR